MSSSKQTQAWSSGFGVAYTERNLMTPDEMDAMYRTRYGISRRAMNRTFLRLLSRGTRILEVGTNVGNQLKLLWEMGFDNLYGIDLSLYAVERGRERTKTQRGIHLIPGSVLDIPFKDGFFDLVFTSGVLIHINPEEIGTAMQEMHRCTRKYIWGMEYFAPEYTRVDYRESDETSDLLWKANFLLMFYKAFRDLELVNLSYYQHQDSSGNKDAMYLLRKVGT